MKPNQENPKNNIANPIIMQKYFGEFRLHPKDSCPPFEFDIPITWINEL